MYSYVAYGLGIRSELPLPELVEGEAVADVVVRLGQVNRRRPQSAAAGTYFWATADECCLFHEEVGTLLVRGGREIIVDPAPAADEDLLRLVVVGAAMGALLHQRGLLVLHASAVAVNGGAVAFLGGPGQGKSTTAAALHARGHDMVADDVVAVDPGGGQSPIVLPAFPRFKLWPEAAVFLGDDPKTLPRLHPRLEKRDRRVTAGFAQTPVPLRRIYVLGEGPALDIEPLRPQEAVVELVRHSLCVKLLPAGGQSRHLLQCASLAKVVPIRRLNRPRCISLLPDLAKLVEEHVAHSIC